MHTKSIGMLKRLVIFGSGAGSNARNICAFFKNKPEIEVVALVSNKPQLGFESIAQDFQIPCILLDKTNLNNEQFWFEFEKKYQPDLVVLAGFLWLIPQVLINHFPKIINLHPSLLPKFGGAGMYGHFVHDAVVQSTENQSGITIHWVNEQYDKGKIIAQFACEIPPSRNAGELDQRIRQLEKVNFPKVIENILKHD